MKKKILIVDDEVNICEMVTDFLSEQGFAVASVHTTDDAVKKITVFQPDLVLLDVRLPTIGGIEFCRRLRSDDKTRHLPIIMLTVQSMETDKVIGLEMGADDYITKPFSQRELMARIKALFRRLDHQGGHRAEIRVGDLVVDLDMHVARLKSRILPLTPKEFDLLALLAKTPNRAFSRESLLASVWGYNYVGSTGTVDVHIQHLRRKLGPHADNLKTVVGVGYRFDTNT